MHGDYIFISCLICNRKTHVFFDILEAEWNLSWLRVQKLDCREKADNFPKTLKCITSLTNNLGSCRLCFLNIPAGHNHPSTSSSYVFCRFITNSGVTTCKCVVDNWSYNSERLASLSFLLCWIEDIKLQCQPVMRTVFPLSFFLDKQNRLFRGKSLTWSADNIVPVKIIGTAATEPTRVYHSTVGHIFRHNYDA